MKKTRLFEWRGTEVFLHPTFIILPALIAGPELLSGRFSEAMTSISYMAVIFFCIVLHEFGHIGMARKLGFQTGDIVLTPLGGLVNINAVNESGRDEVLIAAAGPAVNVAIIALSYLLMNMIPDGAMGGSWATLAHGLYTIILLNSILVIFNLIPLFPMDGGRILRGILRMWMAPGTATRIAVYVSWAVAVIISIWAVMIGNFIIPVIAVFMCLVGYKELSTTQHR